MRGDRVVPDSAFVIVDLWRLAEDDTRSTHEVEADSLCGRVRYRAYRSSMSARSDERPQRAGATSHLPTSRRGVVASAQKIDRGLHSRAVRKSHRR